MMDTEKEDALRKAAGMPEVDWTEAGQAAAIRAGGVALGQKKKGLTVAQARRQLASKRAQALAQKKALDSHPLMKSARIQLALQLDRTRSALVGLMGLVIGKDELRKARLMVMGQHHLNVWWLNHQLTTKMVRQAHQLMDIIKKEGEK